MKIQNLARAALKKPPCGTWLQFWESHAKKSAPKCSVIGCATLAEVGAQVTKPSMGSVTFVVPLCNEHGSHVATNLDVAESTLFVLANKPFACAD